MMRAVPFTTPFAVVALLLADVAAQSVPQRPGIDEAAIAGAIRFLSSDLLEGRGVGSRGDELARLYIATEFERTGLVPATAPGVANDGSAEGDDPEADAAAARARRTMPRFDQPVPILGITTAVTATLTAKGAKGEASFEAPSDFTAVAGNATPAATWDDAELVFVGYGIDAPEQQWDDFEGVDVRGKVLLVMNNDPAGDPALFAGDTRLYYGRWTYKYEEAARRGAIGAIVVHTTPSAGYPFHVIQGSHGRENFWLPFTAGEPTLPIRSWCSEDAAKKLCALGGQDLDALRARAERRDFAAVPLGVTVHLAVQNTVRELQSANVLGVLPGSDPVLAGEYVVVTAHFDHLGIGAPRNGDSIYNGAVDNASGIAGMLAVARACAAASPRPKRSILFAAVTAEESGLLGSEWLAAHLPVDKQRVVADFNIDGLNVWGRTEDVEFIGYGKSSLTKLAEQVAKEHGRRLKPDANPDLGLFYRSDHFNFARIGVPSAYLKAGSAFLDRPQDRKRMKDSYTAVHYHQPSDAMAPWWNLEGAVADMALLFDCLVRTANGPAPTWTPGDEFEKAR